MADSREELVRMAKRTMQGLRDNQGELVDDQYLVPVENYFDQDRWQAEVDRIFKRLPLVLGFSCQMREVGSYSAVTVLGVPTKFLPHAKPDRLLSQLGLDADGIVAAVEAARS